MSTQTVSPKQPVAERQKYQGLTLNEKHQDELENFFGLMSKLRVTWKLYPSNGHEHLRTRGRHDCPISAVVRSMLHEPGRPVNVSVSCARMPAVYQQVGLSRLTSKVVIAATDGRYEDRYFMPRVRAKLLELASVDQ